ncbi:MAG: CheR family methyltransferase, partial [Polyangia bacterium]
MLLRLTPQVFSLMASLVEERAGLFYAPADADLFASKLSARAGELGFDALLDYYYFLRYDTAGEEECDRLIEALVVHETYFFREESALRALVDHFIAPRVQAGARVRVWCAACATGEEPITLAVLLVQRDLLGS